MSKKIYIIGSLRNPDIPYIANRLDEEGYEGFADWHCAGPEADDYWKEHYEKRGKGYLKAIDGDHAWNVFQFDKKHLDESVAALLVLPAGKSGHLELGYMIGSGKPGYILLDTPDRWDVMYRFANYVDDSLDAIIMKMGEEL